MIIQSVQRSLEILSLFSLSQPRWGITDIASATGLAKGTVHNIVHTLVQGGFLMQDSETRKYTLGYSLFTLGTILAGTLEINQKASGIAHRLASQTRFVCRVAIWDKNAALVTLNAIPDYTNSLSRQIGPKVVAYCSAIGRALLAFLDQGLLQAYLDQVEMVSITPRTVIAKEQLLEILNQTRNQGFAVSDQELAPGQSSIGAPIFKSGGKLAASISLSGSTDKVMKGDMDDLVLKLRSAATEISRYMGFYAANPEGGRTHEPIR